VTIAQREDNPQMTPIPQMKAMSFPVICESGFSPQFRLAGNRPPVEWKNRAIFVRELSERRAIYH
jgi:hypothetical protein